MEIKFNHTTIDTNTFLIQQDGQPVDVEPKVYDLIVYLIKNRQRVVSRDDILDSVWKGVVVSDTSLSNRIKSARQVLGDDGQLQHTIKTVHGRGYQFVAQINEGQPKRFFSNNKIAKQLLLLFGLTAIILTLRHNTALQSKPICSWQGISMKS